MSFHAGISVPDIDDPEPIRNYTRDIALYTGSAMYQANSAANVWRQIEEYYVDSLVGPEIYNAYLRPASESEMLASAGGMAARSLERLADAYEYLRLRRAQLVEEIEGLERSEKTSGEGDESRLDELRRSAQQLSADKEEADALCIVELSSIPSPTGMPRSKDSSSGFYQGIEEKASAGMGDLRERYWGPRRRAVQEGMKLAGGSVIGFGTASGALTSSWVGFKPPGNDNIDEWVVYGASKSLLAGSLVAPFIPGNSLNKVPLPSVKMSVSREERAAFKLATQAAPSIGVNSIFKPAVSGYFKKVPALTAEVFSRDSFGGPNSSGAIMSRFLAGDRTPWEKKPKNYFVTLPELKGDPSHGNGSLKIANRGANAALSLVAPALEEWNAAKNDPPVRRAGKAATVGVVRGGSSLAFGYGGAALGSLLTSEAGPLASFATGAALETAGAAAGGEVSKPWADALKERGGEVAEEFWDDISHGRRP